jgi:hypothetical protein
VSPVTHKQTAPDPLFLEVYDTPDGKVLKSTNNSGVHGGAVVEVLLYKPEGRGFDSR